MFCHPYCKPFPPTLKEFFCLPGNFFCKSQQPAHRRPQQAGQKGRKIGKKFQNFPDEPARREGVDPSAQAKRGDVKDPYPAVPPHQGVNEQGEGEAQPEQSVQQMLQPAPAQPVAEHPHTVVDHPRGPAQESGSAEEGGLFQDIDLHQRNRREKKPPRSSLPSSS